MNFHKADQDKSAYRDADLSRLQFAYANAFGEAKNERYKTALAAFAQGNAKYELSAMARDRWASVLDSDGDHVQARKIAADFSGGPSPATPTRRSRTGCSGSSPPRPGRGTGRGGRLPRPSTGPGDATNPRYLVTDLAGDGRALYEGRDCARGEIENRIKEQQLQMFADRTSCHAFAANQFRVLLAAATYVLVAHIRRVGLAGTELARAEVGTIRLRLLKVGAWVARTARRVVVRMSSAYPWPDVFTGWPLAGRDRGSRPRRGRDDPTARPPRPGEQAAGERGPWAPPTRRRHRAGQPPPSSGRGSPPVRPMKCPGYGKRFRHRPFGSGVPRWAAVAVLRRGGG